MTEQIQISRELVEAAPGPGKCVSRKQQYSGDGLKRIETRIRTVMPRSADRAITWRWSGNRHTSECTIRSTATM